MIPILLAAALSAAQPTPAAPNLPAPAATVPYPDMADRVLAAPVAAVATIERATRLRGERAAGVAEGRTRFYVEAAVTALVKGAGGLPPSVAYLVDAPNDARGRPARLRHRRVILIGRTVPSRPGELQLAGSAGQIDWTPGDEAQLRAILTEAAAPGAAPAITGIASAYHVPGAIPGESETQIFLATADRRPVSLSILRRPGEDVRWAVSLTEIVDEAAGAPARGTLLHYRLACGLPETLPAQVLADAEPQAAEAARTDYRVIKDALGACRSQPDVTPPEPATSSG